MTDEFQSFKEFHEYNKKALNPDTEVGRALADIISWADFKGHLTKKLSTDLNWMALQEAIEQKAGALAPGQPGQVGPALKYVVYRGHSLVVDRLEWNSERVSGLGDVCDACGSCTPENPCGAWRIPENDVTITYDNRTWKIEPKGDNPAARLNAVGLLEHAFKNGIHVEPLIIQDALAAAVAHAAGQIDDDQLVKANTAVVERRKTLPEPWSGPLPTVYRPGFGIVRDTIEERLLEGNHGWARQGSMYADRMAEAHTTDCAARLTRPIFTTGDREIVASGARSIVVWEAAAEDAWLNTGHGGPLDSPQARGREEAWQNQHPVEPLIDTHPNPEDVMQDDPPSAPASAGLHA